MGANRCHLCIGGVTFKEHELCLAKLSLVLSHTFTTKMQTINAVLVVTVIQAIHVMAPFQIIHDIYNLLTTKRNEFVHNAACSISTQCPTALLWCRSFTC